jgi:hypothetical protein
MTWVATFHSPHNCALGNLFAVSDWSIKKTISLPLAKWHCHLESIKTLSLDSSAKLAKKPHEKFLSLHLMLRINLFLIFHIRLVEMNSRVNHCQQSLSIRRKRAIQIYSWASCEQTRENEALISTQEEEVEAANETTHKLWLPLLERKFICRVVKCFFHVRKFSFFERRNVEWFYDLCLEESKGIMWRIRGNLILLWSRRMKFA